MKASESATRVRHSAKLVSAAEKSGNATPARRPGVSRPNSVEIATWRASGNMSG